MADEKTFNWIHLSNLDISEENRDLTKYFIAFAGDAETLQRRFGKIDAVFITGDIFQKEGVYSRELFTLFRNEYFGFLDKNVPIIFVPGDQEARPTHTLQNYLLESLLDKPEILHDFLQEESGLRTIAASAFAEYLEFANFFNLATVAGNGSQNTYNRRLSTWLPGDMYCAIDTGSASIGIVGLNSAYAGMMEESSYTGNVLLEKQFLCAITDSPSNWTNQHDLTILLTHHPREQLSAKNHKEFREGIVEAGNFTLHLCGSTEANNTPNKVEMSTQYKNVLSVQAPRFSAPNSGYIFGQVLWVDHENIQVSLLPRTYFQESKEFDDAPYWENERHHYINTRYIKPTAFPYLKSVQVDNFRCLTKTTLKITESSSLGGKWLCLAGINGAGKTSILQAIALGLFGQENVTELGDKRLREMIASNYSYFELALQFIDDSQAQSLSLRYPTSKPTPEENTQDVLRKRTWNTLKDLVIVVAYGATRNISVRRDTRYDDYSQQLRQIITLFDPLSQIASADVFLQDTTEHGENFRPLFCNLIQHLFEDDFEVELEGNRLRFKVEDNLVAAHDLPDGFRSSIAWLADICYLWCQKFPERAQSGKTEDIEAIVLIDEIDLHLHPSLQRTLVPRLRSALPKVQWIVTTHSPLILSCFDKTEIVALDRTAEGGIRKLDRQIMGFSMDQIYEWLMGTKPSSAAMERELERLEETGEEGSEELIKALTHSPTVGEKEAEEARIRRQNLLKRIMQ